MRVLLQDQVQSMEEIAVNPSNVDAPVGRSQVWIENSVTVAVGPRPEINLAYMGPWLLGAIMCGETYEFIEADMEYFDNRFTPAFTLGKGSIEST